MSDLKARILRNANLSNYLFQLSQLTGRKVTESELSSIKEVEKLKNKSEILENYPKKSFKIRSEDIIKDTFKTLVNKLVIANSLPTSIWLSATSYCGTYYLQRVDEFNFNFPFNLVPDGIVVLLTKDCKDKLLIDFGYDSMEIEFQGKSWINVLD